MKAQRTAAGVLIAALLAAGPVAAAQTAPVLPMTVWGSVTTAAGSPVGQGTVQAFLGGAVAGGQGIAVSGSGTFGGGAGSLAPDLTVAGTAGDAAQPVVFTVGGLAAAARIVSCATDPSGQLAAGAPVTWQSGAACQIALTVAAQPPSVPLVTSLAAGTGAGQSSVTVGGAGTAVPDDSATASGGTGTAAVGSYAGNPEAQATPPFQAGGSFFDVSLSPGSTFTAVAIQACNVAAGQQLYWWNGSAWAAVSPQSTVSGCLVAQLSATSSPTLAQLAGTPFAAATPAPAATTGSGGSSAPPPSTSATTPAPTQPTSGTAPTLTFSDVPASFWAYSAIQALASKGIVTGFPDGTFRPNDPVTRAQFAKMLVLTLGLKPSSAATPFTDVPAAAWYAPYVAAAANAGLVDGLTPTTFGPDQPLTREQMAVLLDRALKLPASTAPLTFSDRAAIAAWAVPAVEAAVAAGYLSGFPNGTFQPLAATTRAQAAKVLDLVLQARTATGSSSG